MGRYRIPNGNMTLHVYPNIADARGHGVQAALPTMLLRSEYERVRREPGSPATVLEQLNRRICRWRPLRTASAARLS